MSLSKVYVASTTLQALSTVSSINLPMHQYQARGRAGVLMFISYVTPRRHGFLRKLLSTPKSCFAEHLLLTSPKIYSIYINPDQPMQWWLLPQSFRRHPLLLRYRSRRDQPPFALAQLPLLRSSPLRPLRYRFRWPQSCWDRRRWPTEI